MSEEWISAVEAYNLVAGITNPYMAPRAICARANDGLIDARSARLIMHDRVEDDAPVPKKFWWARGDSALKQNWKTGDFETWINDRYHWKAYGVSFGRAGIEALVGPALADRKADATTQAGGRPRAAWWDNLWIEICRQLWVGDLKPEKQSEIESAMKDWASSQGQSPADSTIRERARKLWAALNKKDEN